MLKPALSESSAKAPTSWQQLAHGEWLRQQVCHVMAPFSDRIFGYHMARVGHLAKAVDLPDIRVKHQFSVAPQGQVDVRAEPTQWPFAEHALDAILQVGQLEFERDPHQFLRELTHSLIADGYLLYVGFNPLSPALLTGFWPSHLRQAPWSGRYFTKARIRDWLSLLNFEVVEHGYFAPTLLIEKLDPPDRGMQSLFKLLPKCGAMYYIVARKREYPLTLVKTRKQSKARIATLPVANRTGDELC
ncbi:methyltransferase domain-containing protein [Pseudidiomarina aestuarii]|uniref:methyltransferase domain-containing protein n=1 Tax=Pseudidiomarina aestuarii TaxID=624146 RepID=UPI003A972F1B